MAARANQEGAAALKVVAAQGQQTDDAVITDSLDLVLQQMVGEQMPLVNRASATRNRLEQHAREVRTAITDLDAREAMLDRLIEAAKQGLAIQRHDLMEELSLYTNGLGEPKSPF